MNRTEKLLKWVPTTMNEQMTQLRVRTLAARAVRRGAYVAVQLGLDAAALVAAFLLAYLVRLDFSWSSAVRTAGGSGAFSAQGAWVSLLLLAMFAPFRVYRRMWRFMGFVDMPVFANQIQLSAAFAPSICIL